jgi:phosphotransferase system enzyme I (PtsI)
MLPYYEFKAEENPFLGLRAVRFCLQNPEIFKTQLKAILRTSANYKVKIMFPMIGSEKELLDALALLNTAKEELGFEQIPYDQNIQVGIMIEIPAAVFAIDVLAKHIDFVSIGTNDLCQYTLAVDRLNADVSYLYDSLNISILRMIDHVVKGCCSKGIEVGVCGEMASDLEAAKILIGLGVDELSVSPIMIPYIKEMMLNETYSGLQERAKQLISL